MSRTERVRAKDVHNPEFASSTSGAPDIRKRLGLSPTTPQQEAGSLMEPPPSFPCATGTIPLATAAAEPPLDPPVLYCKFHGFRVAPCSRLSVVLVKQHSGVFVLPTRINPACLNFFVRLVSSLQTDPCKSLLPALYGNPATIAPESFTSNGTPANGALLSTPV